MRRIPSLFISLYAVSITQFEQTSLIHEVCDWFGIDYGSASCEAGDRRENQHNEIRNLVVEWAEKYTDKQMNFTTLKDAYTSLEMKIHPLIAQMNKEKKNAVRKIEIWIITKSTASSKDLDDDTGDTEE